MSDPIFEHPRLVAIYDAFDGARTDLEHYVTIAKNLHTRSVIDVGCGTGSLACLLSKYGFDVTGLEPAEESLKIARKKPYADQVQWILGDSSDLPSLGADLAVMTGNVAQVFLGEEEWETNLRYIRQALHPSGYLVFEVRDPDKKTWLNWTRDQTYKSLNISNIGTVEGWCDLINVSEELISFRWTYVFSSTGETLSSDSTLRFRSKEKLINSLERSGYIINEISDAPDRPKEEFVFHCSVSPSV